MKIAAFLVEGETRGALVRADGVVDLSALARGSVTVEPVGVGLVRALVSGDVAIVALVAQAKSRPIQSLPLINVETATFLPPVPDCRQILAVGLNYRSHCAEQGKEPPEIPMFFAKLPSCMTGHQTPITHWPATASMDFEGELAVVIGRGGRAIAEQSALSHVFGYTIMNDVTARDLQRRERQWTRAKSLDGFGPMGPVIVTADEIPDPGVLRIQTRVNDVLVQSSSTADMVHSVASLVARASEAITLSPGDVLVTGTPAGVGAFADPPRFLTPGDRICIEIDEIGTLENKVVAP